MTGTQIFENKVAIVTGSSQGLGLGTAQALAQGGAKVVLVGRTQATLETAARTILDAGGVAGWVVGDVANQATADESVAYARENFGPVDLLINNAQEISVGTLLELEIEQFELNLRSGPLAAFQFMKACHSDLVDGGVIINMLTAAGIRWDMETFGAYGAAKQAFAAITRTAACEWGPSGIRVLGVMPIAGTAGWDAYREVHPDEAQDFLGRIPLRRMGDPTQIGRMIAVLCGPDASYMTGSIIKIDGGFAP
jgi:NAD(P)-dependent dehydrogenase (short-subunit alcohol dehydrogenase family)